MSVDLNVIASNFNCSVDDVKGMLVDITTQLPAIIDIIESSINSDDFSSVKMATDMVTSHISHFQLNDMQSAVDSLISSANAEDKSASQINLDSLKSTITQLESLL